jgi:hypothetical protein
VGQAIIRQANGWFAKGTAGGLGRPRGSKQKLSERFIDALHADFCEFGEAAIERVRQEDPGRYLTIVSGLVKVHRVEVGEIGESERHEQNVRAIEGRIGAHGVQKLQHMVQQLEAEFERGVVDADEADIEKSPDKLSPHIRNR